MCPMWRDFYHVHSTNLQTHPVVSFFFVSYLHGYYTNRLLGTKVHLRSLATEVVVVRVVVKSMLKIMHCGQMESSILWYGAYS